MICGEVIFSHIIGASCFSVYEILLMYSFSHRPWQPRPVCRCRLLHGAANAADK